MAVDLTKFLKGRSLKAADFNFNDTTDVVEIKTGAGSAVGTAIAAATPAATTTVAGLIEEATGEETRLGATDVNKDDRAVTPGSMSYTLQGGRDYRLNTLVDRSGDFDANLIGLKSSGDISGASSCLNAYVANATVSNIVSAISGTILATSVTGAGTKRGVTGISLSPGGTNIGVYGFATSGTTNWAGYFAGNVFYSGSLTSSDERLKDNFTAAPDLSTVKIESFDKYSVTKDEDGKEVRTKIGRFTGVRAQAVQAVAPEMVSEAGDYLAVQESSILFSMIDGLRKEVAALKAAK